MKKHLILLAAASLIALMSCKGGTSGDNINSKLLNEENQPVFPHAYVFTVKGIVVCPTCKTDNVLTIGLEDEDGTYLLTNPYVTWFEDGSYEIKNVTLEEGDKILVRAYVDKIYPLGKASDLVEVPDSEGTLKVPSITIP